MAQSIITMAHTATNYDGAHRNASDNNTVYMALWLSF